MADAGGSSSGSTGILFVGFRDNIPNKMGNGGRHFPLLANKENTEK